MAASQEQIFVKSHVARDLLQNAALFKSDRLVVWEYVSNGLQYVDPGTNPVVTVNLDSKRKRIIISDNGRGMDWVGLQNFFVMHGENLDRKKGRPGRGRFGTGKSAAFGIAEVLHITTVRNKKRSQVELNRMEVEKMTSEDPIPIRTIEKEIRVQEKNGTVIRIEGVYLRSLDQPGIIRYIERHLAKWPRNVTVIVNGHECEFFEPPVLWEKKFKAEGITKDLLGNVELVVKVSKSPLDQDFRGVSIYSSGVWHETTLVGSEGREMSQFIFGEIDIPKLGEDKSPIPPFDVSRSMQLNPNNELVRTIYAFVGRKVEEVRRVLVQEEKKRKASEEARKLAKQASEIAQVINEDFDAFRKKVAVVKAKASGSLDMYRPQADSDKDGTSLLPGSQVPAQIVFPIGAPGSSGGTRKEGNEPRKLGAQVSPGSPEDKRLGRPASEVGDRSKSYGGFRVSFDHMGEEAHRAQYQRSERTIYINLDHPQLVAAKGLSSIDDPPFRRLAYEVAFAEYAIALASELAAQDEYIDPSDPIVDIRETLNRTARKGAQLYSK